MHKLYWKRGSAILFVLILFFWTSIIPDVFGKTVKTLSIVDRIEQRIMPELYYALKTAAGKNPELDINFQFTIFSPRKHDCINYNPVFAKNSVKMLNYLRSGVGEVISIKKELKNNEDMVELFFRYISKNKNSFLAKAYRYAELIMGNYDFLIIEPTFVSVVHPIFWNKDCQATDSKGASAEDLIDTAYALMFFEIAIKMNKPVIGQCHGAQIGYLYAGGELKKIFDIYKEQEFWPAIYGRENPYGGPCEIWNIDQFLQNRYWDDPSIIELTKYPFPEYVKQYMGIKGKEIYLNKEMQHTLAMINKPAAIDIFTYHPLSINNITDSYKFNPQLAKKFSYLTKRTTEDFKKLIIKKHIIDFYKYKTMIGTQYHPQITYDDYDTSIFFDFLIKFIRNTLDKNAEHTADRG